MSATDEPPPQTRAARRTARESARSGRLRGLAPTLTGDTRPLEVFAILVLAGLLALTAYAGWIMVGAVVVLAGLVLALGWPRLLDSSSPRGTTVVVAIASLGTVAAVLADGTGPYLQYVPVAIAGSIMAMFLHQLVRRDGRPRLTQSLTAAASAVAVVTSGVGFVPLPQTYGGAEAIAAAAAAIAASAPVDLYASRPRLRPWLLLLVAVVGGAAAAGVAVLSTQERLAGMVLIGVLASVVSHAVRRILAPQPQIRFPQAQLTSACASVLSPGLLVYTVARIFLA